MKYDKREIIKVAQKYNISCKINTPMRKLMYDILTSKDVILIFYDLNKTEQLKHLLPEFIGCIGLDQRTIHHLYTTDIHILNTVLNISNKSTIEQNDRELLIWCAFLHDIGKPLALKHNLKSGTYRFTGHAKYSAKLTPKILRRFGFKHKEIVKMKKIVANHEFFRMIKLYNMGYKGNRMSVNYVFKTINRVGKDNFRLILLLHQADLMAQSEYMRDKKILINKRVENIYNYYLNTIKSNN